MGTIPMDKNPKAQLRKEGDRGAFYVVWSLEGGNPVVRFPAFAPAKPAAWRLSEKHPGQSFFVLKTCWDRLARPPEATASDMETPEGGDPVDPA